MAQDFDQYIAGLRAKARAETEDVSKAMNPRRELRPRVEIERHPDSHQRQTEREGRSNWSGGNMGGGSWGGRSRGEGEQP
jgi:hypothetical protein